MLVRRRTLESCARDLTFHPLVSPSVDGVVDGDWEVEGRERERNEGVVRTRKVRERENRGGDWRTLGDRVDAGVEESGLASAVMLAKWEREGEVVRSSPTESLDPVVLSTPAELPDLPIKPSRVADTLQLAWDPSPAASSTFLLDVDPCLISTLLVTCLPLPFPSWF